MTTPLIMLTILAVPFVPDGEREPLACLTGNARRRRYVDQERAFKALRRRLLDGAMR